MSHKKSNKEKLIDIIRSEYPIIINNEAMCIVDISSIEKPSDERFYIDYIYKNSDNSNFTFFKSSILSIKYTELKSLIRDISLETLLSESKEDSESDNIEELIYTEEELEKLNKLRGNYTKESEIYNLMFLGREGVSPHKIIFDLEHEWCKQFKVGDNVFYNNNPGVITFEHQFDPKKDGNHKQLWTVSTKDGEFRYTSGLLLKKRIVDNKYLDKVVVDPKYIKMDTKKLLVILKKERFRNRDIFNQVKKVLNTREHVPTEKSKKIKDRRKVK